MTKDNEKTQAQKILSKITNRPVIAYILVVAAVLGSIANFTGTLEKAYESSKRILSHLSKVDINRPSSVWVRLEPYNIKDETGVIIKENPKAGQFIQVESPPIREAIVDPLPLIIASVDGDPPKPRRLPLPKLYDMYYDTIIPKGIYRLLDVDIIERPSGRVIVQEGKAPPKVIYIDSDYNKIIGPITQTQTEVWGRIEYLDSFGHK